MKKAFDQTVRDLKRGVNKKVLKVPSTEQKVLDATSNEPWGPHGSLLADIAQASRNYHEYQMIMSVIWKRINDTGKNWRHVYKALTVLEYLVAHGSERVIDDIREHAYQISTLSDFQYIDSSGRDQGNNVRKKSQSLVVLVNDKERIQEVRQKAAANREKYRSTGSMHRPGSISSSGGYGDRYDDDRYEGRNRDDDRNGYGRERDWGSKDDDRYGRYGDSYGRDGDRYSRDSEERYGRDGYRDDDYRGRSRSTDDYHYGFRSKSADRDRDRAYEDDGYSARGSSARADDDGSTSKRLQRKYSEQNLSAPPSYEEAVGPTRSPTYSERDGESSLPSAPKALSPKSASPSHITAAAPTPGPASPPAPASARATAKDSHKEVYGFDEFDPRGSFSAAPAISNATASVTSGDAEMDFLGSLSESFSSNSLALVPANEPTMTPEVNAPGNFSSGPTFAAAAAAASSAVSNQPFDDPFGDGPFKALPSTDSVPAQQQITTSTNSHQGLDVLQSAPQKSTTEFGGNFYDGSIYMPSGPSGTQPPPTNPHLVQQDFSTPNQDIDILADILPPSGQSVSHAGFPPQTNQPASQFALPSQNSFQEPNLPPSQPSLQTSYPLQSAENSPQTRLSDQSMALSFPIQAGQTSQTGAHSQTSQPTVFSGFPSQRGLSQAGVQAPLGGQIAQPNPPNSNFYGAYHSQPVSPGPILQHNFVSPSSSAVPVASQMVPQAPLVRPSYPMAPVSTMPASTASSAIVPQPSSDKFETKSTVWADTLSRGLVNLNISGSKTNPLADIGVDFDAINRKDKRMEKPTTTAVTSTITMGKAMGSGSGMGRAGATALRPPPNPMVGSGMNISMTGGPRPGPGMNMGGYGVSQPMGRGMGMKGPNMGVGMNAPNMGMGMNVPNMGMRMNVPYMGMRMNGPNMGTGQGIQMQQPTGFPPGSTMSGGYNPMMGSGNYGQQPYNGNYR
ncbi:hypothetical protein ACJIZ3_018038 [Penstemon smallii]|uniref:ENTH domain-containing protein n=1 Tax=Penstemon smallii TaxID=265156 RepID=A0ABD3SX72_9LAMI